MTIHFSPKSKDETTYNSALAPRAFHVYLLKGKARGANPQNVRVHTMRKLLLRPDAETREFEKIGEANSPDELIDFYNKFDWTSFEKTIASRQQRGLPSFSAILRFERNDTDYVELAESKKGAIFINCLLNDSALETVISRDVNKRNFSIEEFLTDFWNHTHADKYRFEKFSVASNNKAMRAKFPFTLLWPLLFPVGIGSIIFFTDKHITMEGVALMFGIPFLFTVPYFLLLIHYFSVDRTTSIDFQNRGASLTIYKQGVPRTIKRNEITRARIYRCETGKSLIYGWGYLLLDVGPKDRIVITSFVSEDLENIAEQFGIKYSVIPAFYPWIRLRLKTDSDIQEEVESFKTKQTEFISRWQNKSPEELQKVVSSKSEYAEYAVEAAKNILKNKYGL